MDSYKMFCHHQKNLSNAHLSHLSQSNTRTTSHFRMWQVFKKFNPVPIVHAQEVEGPPTSVDLLHRKPAVVISDAEVRSFMEKETGRDRLRELYTMGEKKELHPDMTMVADSVTFCSFTLFVCTSVFGSMAAKEKFVRKSQHRTYETKFRAMRAYNDAIIFGGMKFGMTWAFKGFVFTSIFLGTAQSIASYRNRTSVWEYMAGGFATGAVLRMSLGLKGMFAGGVIGSTLGLIGGSCIYLLLYSSNETQQQRHYWRIQEKLRTQRELELQFPKHSSTGLDNIPNPLPS